MPDKRKHRGPHPKDTELFAATELPRLRRATAELSTLLGWNYAPRAALTLVGDHHQLKRRQRLALQRCAASPASAQHRRASLRSPAGASVAVDGFNLLVTLEAALAGGVLLLGADGRLRDLASMHGSWRRMAETEAALDLLVEPLARAREVRWILDRPVSNSARLAEMVRQRGWAAELSNMADKRLVELSREGAAVATADGPLIDRVEASVDLTKPLVAGISTAWVVDLGLADGHNPVQTARPLS